MTKCGLCAEEIKDEQYKTVYKGTKNKLVLIAHTKCFADDKYDAIVKEILGSA